MPRKIEQLPDVARALGESPKRFLLANCMDPLLTRVAIDAAYLNKGDDDAAVAERQAVSAALVRRIRELHWDPKRRAARWRHHVPEKLVEAFVAAATGAELTLPLSAYQRRFIQAAHAPAEGPAPLTIHQDLTVSVRPCVCGSMALAPVAIREIASPLCLRCRTDQIGEEWADIHDAYIAHPELWLKAGFALSIEASQDPTHNLTRPLARAPSARSRSQRNARRHGR